MMVRYIYKPFDTHGRAGWYQCDLEDFKKFCKAMQNSEEYQKLTGDYQKYNFVWCIMQKSTEPDKYWWSYGNGWKHTTRQNWFPK